MNKIYLDSCIYIYYLENHSEFGKISTKFFEAAEKGISKIIASPLILHELMTGIYEHAEIPHDEIYSYLLTHPGIEWANYDISTADLSAQLRARLKIKTPDSIHLATAIHTNCTKFVTNDKKLKNVDLSNSIKVSIL